VDSGFGCHISKIAWLALKVGKPVLSVNPKFTSQECSACHHDSKTNRDGEKFICENCGHIAHADTQASRTILGRANLKFVSKADALRSGSPTMEAHQADAKKPTRGLCESYACQL
jgi:putative transposase